MVLVDSKVAARSRCGRVTWSGPDWMSQAPSTMGGGHTFESFRASAEGAVILAAAVDEGEWLVAHRWEMDRGESAWLLALAGVGQICRSSGPARTQAALV